MSCFPEGHQFKQTSSWSLIASRVFNSDNKTAALCGEDPRDSIISDDNILLFPPSVLIRFSLDCRVIDSYMKSPIDEGWSGNCISVRIDEACVWRPVDTSTQLRGLEGRGLF